MHDVGYQDKKPNTEPNPINSGSIPKQEAPNSAESSGGYGKLNAE